MAGPRHGRLLRERTVDAFDHGHDFTRGGWGPRYNDEVMGRELSKVMAKSGDLLFGRRTWQDFTTAWGHATTATRSPRT